MAVLEMVMDKEPYSAYNQETLAGAAAVSIQKAARVLGEMEYRGLLHTSSPGRFTLKRVIDKLSLKIMETMSALLSKKPEDPALRPEEIRMNLPKMEDRLFREIIGRLKEEGRICEKSGLLFPADYRPVFPEEKTRCFQWVAEVFARPGFSPPSRGELLSGGDFPRKTMEEVLGYMAFRDDIVAIDDSIYMTGQQIGQARKILGGHILKNGPLTPSQAAKLLGTTRKYAIPLLEYLDKTYFTRRIKEGRVLFRDNIMAES
jgi:selenocysteine-specific elongation factor